jgi:predicted nucleic acid-binding protein
MILPDLNLLLYAYNPHVPQHERAAAWWRGVVQREELVGLPNEVCLGFVRIATNQRLGPAAITIREAREVVES